MFLESSKDAIVDLSQQIVEQLQVPQLVFGLLFVDLGRFVVCCADIAQIDGFNLVLLLQGLEEVGLPEDVRSGLHALDVLPLPNGSTEEEQLLARGYFILLARNHGTASANRLYSHQVQSHFLTFTHFSYRKYPSFLPAMYTPG